MEEEENNGEEEEQQEEEEEAPPRGGGSTNCRCDRHLAAAAEERQHEEQGGNKKFSVSNSSAVPPSPAGAGDGLPEKLPTSSSASASAARTSQSGGERGSSSPSPASPSSSLLSPHANRLLRLLGDAEAGRPSTSKSRRQATTTTSSAPPPAALASAAQFFVRDVLPNLAREQAWEVLGRLQGRDHLAAASWSVRAQSAAVLRAAAARLSILEEAALNGNDDDDKLETSSNGKGAERRDLDARGGAGAGDDAAAARPPSRQEGRAEDDPAAAFGGGVDGDVDGVDGSSVVVTLDWLHDNWRRLARDESCLLLSRSADGGGSGSNSHDGAPDDNGETYEANDFSGADDVDAAVKMQLRRQTQILQRRLGLAGPLLGQGGAAARVVGGASGNRGKKGSRSGDSNPVAESDDPTQPLQLTLDDLSGTAAPLSSGPAPRQDPQLGRRPCQPSRKRRRVGNGAPASRKRVAPGNDDDGDDGSDNNNSNSGSGGNQTLQALLRSLVSASSSSDPRDRDRGRRRRHPYDALSGDLLCRMVDPAWHVRHGAMLGALALVQGEWIPSSQQMLRSAWIRNVLVTALYVLAVDRFGDFSGAMFHENPSFLDPASSNAAGGPPPASTILASSVVAPVREVAGQVAAAAWIRSSPESVQSRVVRLLWDMSREVDEWEVRHGALTAFKYMTAVVLSRRRTTNHSSQLEASVALMVDSAAEALRDESDDVKSVAAELLHQYYQHRRAQPDGTSLDASSAATDAVVHSLWKALLSARSHSSCLVSLIDLLQLFVQNDCRGFLRRIDLGGSDGSADPSPTPPSAVVLAQTLARLLDCDFTSVRVAVFQCVNILASPLAEQCAAANNCDTYMLLLDRIFDLFRDVPSLATADNLLHQEGSPALLDPDGSVTRIARSEAWDALAAYAGTAFVRKDGSEPTAFIYALLRRYFTIHKQDGSRFSFEAYEVSSRALSTLLLSFGVAEEGAWVPSILELSLLSYLRSPWSAQCEAACLLVSSLFRSEERRPPPLLLHKIQHAGFVRHLSARLWDIASGSAPLFCLMVESYLTSQHGSLDVPTLIQLCDHDFDKLASQLFQTANDTCIPELSDMIVEAWRRSIEARTGSLDRPDRIEVSFGAMRVCSSVAGATVKVMSLPKVTPIARALVTALQNETSQARLEWTSDSVCSLLLALDDDPKFTKAQEKILETVCTMAESEGSIGTTSYLPGSQSLTKYISRALATRALVEIGPVWSRIAVILDGGREKEPDCVVSCVRLLNHVSKGLQNCSEGSYVQIDAVVDRLAGIATETANDELRREASATLRVLCSIDETRMLSVALRRIIQYLNDSSQVSLRTNASLLLESTVSASGESLCPFVKALLPAVMSLMTDSSEACSRSANKTFASLVRLAPLIQAYAPIRLTSNLSSSVDDIIDHLVLGKPLPPVTLPEAVRTCLSQAGVTLRAYQKEGVSWLRFLQKLKLNGALCDSMGLGKTLQALVAIAISHFDDSESSVAPVSLIVCPSTLVGHWMAEITKFFPGTNVFRPLCYMGSKTHRESLRHAMESSVNVVVTSYAVLRNDADVLIRQRYRCCILDEGHLLKNHMTATARAARRLLARHRLVLTGTPVQNRVQELWATFDFLMPNFLGSAASFASEFAKPIMKGQENGASSSIVVEGLEKLKILHQQVLPFILRREKSEVLKELPPKVVSYVTVPMSNVQAQLYQQLCSNTTVKTSLRRLEELLTPVEKTPHASVDGNTLKSLMLLRLLCTHPSHLSIVSNSSSTGTQSLSGSGKMMALVELMRNAGLDDGCVTAADNDSSLLYCDDPSEETMETFDDVVATTEDSGLAPEQLGLVVGEEKKCIIFAQFTKSLDLVENLVLKPLMPHLRYLRLDGRVPAEKRAHLANRFNTDPSVRLLLSTTRVGGLGLNLTGADTVFFLENDYNPFVDIQAQDRAHRIGQTKCVNIYNLVTENSIEEKMIELQRRKVAVSEAIVNSENSSMFSMGTDRILDIFTSRSSANVAKDDGSTLDIDALIEQHCDDYASLSVDEFLKGLEGLEGDQIRKSKS